MSSVPCSAAKKTACVTGANGFVGSALVKFLLQNGYSVRATVRNPAEATARIAHLEALGSMGDLQLFHGDLLAGGSFDEAVAGCRFVFHVATPPMRPYSDPEKEVIRPAVEGTLNVLRSCVKPGTTVRRVVLTSSGAAVAVPRGSGTAGTVLNEAAWTDVEYLRKEKPPSWGYLASKTLAEAAAWEFAEEHKLDLVVVNPALIFGPSLTPHPPHSVRLVLSLVTGDCRLLSVLKTFERVNGSLSLVHIEDVCRAQLLVAEAAAAPPAKGRYILSAFSGGVRELAAFLSCRYPQYKIATESQLADALPKPRSVFSSAKIIEEGYKFKYEKLEDLCDELIKEGKATGLLPHEGKGDEHGAV